MKLTLPTKRIGVDTKRNELELEGTKLGDKNALLER